MERVKTDAQEVQFATFEVSGLRFGVELCCVQELIRYQEMTAVPLAPAAVSGLINLRGQIVIAVDARRALCLPERNSSDQPMNVVLRSEDGCTSLLVDRIGDVVSVAKSGSVPPPENIPLSLRQKILNVFQMPDSLLLIPDLAQVLG